MWLGWVGVLRVHGVNCMETWEGRWMFRYWKFYGWLMAGAVKQWSLSPSSRPAFCVCGKQKEAWILPSLTGRCSNSCCETRMQEGGERTMSRMENPVEAPLTTDWDKSSWFSKKTQLHLPWQSCTHLWPTDWALAGLFLSVFLIFCGFVVIGEAFPERDDSVCDNFAFL